MSEHYDAVISGAGMVGAAFGCALGQLGCRVAILDGAPPPDGPPAGDYELRVSALTRASQAILDKLRAWDAIAHARVSPFRQMHVWDAGGRQSIHFDAAEVAEATLGHIVENRLIQWSLHQQLVQYDNVELFTPVQLDSFDLHTDHVQVRLADSRTLRTQLLVGADGVDSKVRKLAGIATRGWYYDQHGVVATVRPRDFHQETAWQRFLPEGPLAFLPLADGCCSIVWSTTPQRAEALLAIDDADFRRQLEQAFESRLGPIVQSGPRARFPLRLQHATKYVQPRVALIGDAAHSIHPLAGQGVNLGLLDAAALAQVLREAREAHRDPGDYRVLRRYERWRKGDNLATMAVMDGFKRLFGAQALPLRVLRNAGLGMVDRATPLKRAIIEHAMGLRGDLPPLARAQLRRP